MWAVVLTGVTLDLLSKTFSGEVVFKAVAETPDGWIISGPIASFKKDYDGETLERTGVIKGLKMFFNLGAQIDFEHQYAAAVQRRDPKAPDWLIGKGLRIEEADGTPCLVAMLFKAKDAAGQLSESIVKALRRGVRFGFSIEGKATRHPDDDSRIIETEIHRVTIAPSTKGFDQWIKLGDPLGGRIAKALDILEPRDTDAPQHDLLKAILSTDGWELVKAPKASTEDLACTTCGDPTAEHRDAYHQGFVAGALKLTPYHLGSKSKEALTTVVDPETLDRAATDHTYMVGHATGTRYRDHYEDQFPDGKGDPMSPDPRAAKVKAEHAVAANLHTAVIPAFMQRWTLEQRNVDRCPECGAPGGASKQSTQKAVVSEAIQTCPKCDRKMYCLVCHKQAAAPAKKAMTTGEGVVQGGDTGGRALRVQTLATGTTPSGPGKDKTCRCCGKTCATDPCPECDPHEVLGRVEKSLKLSGHSPAVARAIAIKIAPAVRTQRQPAAQPHGATRAALPQRS